MTYDALNAISDEDIDADLKTLEHRGLLHWDKSANKYDLHPIVRRYAYDRLTGAERLDAHGQLRDYFAAAPPQAVLNQGEEHGSRWIGGELVSNFYLDTQDLLAVTHPDAPDLRLETFTRALFGSEERGVAEAIAINLREMSRLRTPILCVVIGEGGSGGALAIGVCDRLLMLQYSVYSVISPEGCASILWKSADRRELAAEAMGITAERLARLSLVDEVIPEPLGGARPSRVDDDDGCSPLPEAAENRLHVSLHVSIHRCLNL